MKVNLFSFKWNKRNINNLLILKVTTDWSEGKKAPARIERSKVTAKIERRNVTTGTTTSNWIENEKRIRNDKGENMIFLILDLKLFLIWIL